MTCHISRYPHLCNIIKTSHILCIVSNKIPIGIMVFEYVLMERAAFLDIEIRFRTVSGQFWVTYVHGELNSLGTCTIFGFRPSML